MPRQRNGIEREESRVLVAGKGTEALCLRRNLSIAHQAAIEPRDAAVGHDVADGVIDRGVGAAVVGAVVAFEIKRLRLLANRYRLLGKLFGFDGGHLLGLWPGRNPAEVFLQHG